MSKEQKKLPSKVKTTLRVTPDVMSREVAKAKKQASATVTIKGFRKGKAPQHLAEKMLDPEKIEQHALSHIIPELLEQALLQEKETTGRSRMIVVSEPKYDITSYGWPQGQDVIIEAQVELYPEIYTGHIIDQLSVPRPIVDAVTPEQIEEFITRLRNNLLHIRQKDQPNAATEIIISDEDLATTLKLASIDDLKVKAQAELEMDAQYQAEQKFEQAIIDSIIGSLEVDIPESLVHTEIERIVQNVQGQLQRIGATMESYLESQNKSMTDWQTELLEQARKNVLSMLALTELAQDLEITLTEDELTEINKSGNTEQRQTLVLLSRQRKALEKLKDLVTSR